MHKNWMKQSFVILDCVDCGSIKSILNPHHQNNHMDVLHLECFFEQSFVGGGERERRGLDWGGGLGGGEGGRGTRSCVLNLLLGFVRLDLVCP